MDKSKYYISSIDHNAYVLAEKYDLGIELAEYGTAWNLDEKFSETDAEIRNKLIGTPKMVFHGPYSELFPCAIDPLIREVCRKRFLQSVQIAKNYGCQKIVLHGGFNPYVYYPVWYSEQSPVFWKALLRELPEDIQICVENVFEQDPLLLSDIVRAVDDRRFRMCLDIGHAHAYSHISVSEWIEKCKDVIEHFHIHNNDGTADTHRSLFNGTIPMKEVLSQISEQCPQATLTLEMTDAMSSIQYLIEHQSI